MTQRVSEFHITTHLLSKASRECPLRGHLTCFDTVLSIRDVKLNPINMLVSLSLWVLCRGSAGCAAPGASCASEMDNSTVLTIAVIGHQFVLIIPTSVTLNLTLGQQVPHLHQLHGYFLSVYFDTHYFRTKNEFLIENRTISCHSCTLYDR